MTSFNWWTGAVGDLPGEPPGTGWPRDVLAALLESPEDIAHEPGVAEFFLYAAREMGSAPALKRALDALKDGARAAESARLYWDAYALTGDEKLRAAAEKRSGSRSKGPKPAVAARALMRAAAFEDARFGDPALRAVDELSRASAAGGFDLKEGASAVLALTECFQMTGDKSRRDEADRILGGIFQEFWSREKGGFDAPAADNAAAFEGIWRLTHMKGNSSYKRWLSWGLAGRIQAAGENAAEAAPLARIVDMHWKGRMDFQLVAAPGDPEGAALLRALFRRYLPRMVVSFVDPDDQNYVQSHRLVSSSYPALFACRNLRPVFSATGLDQIEGLIAALEDGGRT